MANKGERGLGVFHAIVTLVVVVGGGLIWVLGRLAAGSAWEAVPRYAFGFLVIAVGFGHLAAISVMALIENLPRIEGELDKDQGDNKVSKWVSGVATGLVESVFFCFAVAINLTGAVGAMMAWTAIKAQAHWNLFTGFGEHKPKSDTRRTYKALLGSLVSLFFATIGGLLCADAPLWLHIVGKSSLIPATSVVVVQGAAQQTGPAAGTAQQTEAVDQFAAEVAVAIVNALAAVVFGGMGALLWSTFGQSISLFLFGPRLELKFDEALGSRIDTGVNGSTELTQRHFRLRVENTKQRTAKGCRAYLVKVTKENGAAISYHDTLQLPWSYSIANAAEAIVDIPPDVPQFVGVVFTEQGKAGLRIGALIPPLRYENLMPTGAFCFEVTVTSENAGPARGKFIVHQPGTWDTAFGKPHDD